MGLHNAYNSGVRAAFSRYSIKLALSLGSNGLGASHGVGPVGDEVSHGTARNQYPIRDRASAAPAPTTPQDPFNSDWLWKNQDLGHMAPDNVSGFGSEVIG